MNNFGTNKSHPNSEWRPWENSTGPLSFRGKLKTSKNAKRHGYYSETFCEFRKNRRRPETIQFEWKCLRLIRAVDTNCIDKVNKIIADLSSFFLRTWELMKDKRLKSALILELKYVTTLFERVVRYSLSVILKNLNMQIKEQNGN